MNFVVPPKIDVDPPRKATVNAGQNVTLTCKASGDPQPTVTWTKDGVPQNLFRRNGTVLQLFNVQTKDVGSYRCTVTNGYGMDLTHISIVGLSCKDKFLRHDSNICLLLFNILITSSS